MKSPNPSPLREYIAENYGTCTADTCQCLRTGWRGVNCPNWVPVDASTWEELQKEVK